MENDKSVVVVFSLYEIGVLGALMGYVKSSINLDGYSSEYRKEIEHLHDVMESKMDRVFGGEDNLTNG